MTPTYNRAYILKDAYDSLRTQSSFDFEWIIVDDGSTDETEEIVRAWMEEKKNFSIVYKKQNNGGKHRAVNRGVLLAKYDYFLILDSDDSLANDAVETIHEWIAGIAGLKGFAGIAGLRGKADIAIEGTPQEQYIDATNLERKKYGLLGDIAEIYKTEILKKYPFPEFEGENFIRESAVWDRIAKDGMKIRFYSKIIYLCEYIEDGLTKNTNENTYARNFKGFAYCSKLFLETHTLFPSLNKCGEFRRVAKLKGLGLAESAKMLNVNILYFLIGIGYFKLRRFAKSILRKKDVKAKGYDKNKKKT